MSEIHCSIDNCHYWGQGNNCNASEIMVTADSWASQAPDKIDSPRFASVPQMRAASCMETCCKTFVGKNSGNIRADGVVKKNY